MLCYMLSDCIQAEPMACSIRKCNTIQGIDLPALQSNVLHKEAQISQYVDDTHFFAKNDKTLPGLFNSLRCKNEKHLKRRVYLLDH